MRIVSVSLFLALILCLPAAAQDQVAVVNAASFKEGFPVAPGCWATAFGDFASVGVVNTFADSVPFPTMLGGVQVFVDGVASPMNFAGEGQINFLVPRDTPTEQSVPFRVEVGGMTTFEGMINIFPVSPGLLSINPGDPTRPGAVLNQDSTLNSAENPAQRGDVIQIFGVGADFSQLPEDGAPAPAADLVPTSSTPVVEVDVIGAEVIFSGLAPNLVNAWQLNVTVPSNDFISGQVAVRAFVGGAPTNAVSIWVAE